MIFKLAILAAAVYVGYRLVRGTLGETRSEFPCATCRNCRSLFDDGVICAFGSKETFKNETHIANCRDYERGRRAG